MEKSVPIWKPEHFVGLRAVADRCIFKKIFGKKVSKKQGQPDVYADWGHRYIIHNVERADSGMWDALGEYPEPEEDFYEKALQEAHEVFEKRRFHGRECP